MTHPSSMSRENDNLFNLDFENGLLTRVYFHGNNGLTQIEIIEVLGNHKLCAAQSKSNLLPSSFRVEFVHPTQDLNYKFWLVAISFQVDSEYF